MSKSAEVKEKKRIIGRWYIGETLGKGGYSWVKKGIDVKTGKIVAMKFMEKAEKSWENDQAKLVETEIDALKNIRHKNVIKLYAFSMETEYPLRSVNPNSNKAFMDVILLVLEYAPFGELFDILYYTSFLEIVIARTYFKQLMDGLEACHKAQIVHRDLKPQNLLLDAKYNLKITDFGLSKIAKKDEDKIMKTSYVGTRGYQAPELLLKKKYDLKCDIFSAGVILFILLAGYPPFEQANDTDKWYRSFMQGNFDKFWKPHHKSNCYKDEGVRGLLLKLLAVDPKNRPSISEIKNHPWCKQTTLSQKKLIHSLRNRHRKAEMKRSNDVKKMADLNNSFVIPKRNVYEIVDCEMLPEKKIEQLHSIYTYGNKNTWKDVYDYISDRVLQKKGSAAYDPKINLLTIKMKPKVGISIIFTIKLYQSRKYHEKNKDKNKDDSFVYIIEAKRIEGPGFDFSNIKNNFLLVKCSKVIKGLPKWALKLDSRELKDNQSKNKKGNNDEKDENDEDENEDENEDKYFEICKNVNFKK